MSDYDGEFEPFEIRTTKFRDLMTSYADDIICDELDRDDYEINFNMVDWTKTDNLYHFDARGK